MRKKGTSQRRLFASTANEGRKAWVRAAVSHLYAAWHTKCSNLQCVTINNKSAAFTFIFFFFNTLKLMATDWLIFFVLVLLPPDEPYFHFPNYQHAFHSWLDDILCMERLLMTILQVKVTNNKLQCIYNHKSLLNNKTAWTQIITGAFTNTNLYTEANTSKNIYTKSSS